MNYRKTKIVATIGPATSSKAMLKKIIKAGVNVCRVNFSHGNYEDHEQVIHNIREINTELGTHTAILADLQGPKIRVGKI
jgi:pyruvate kinase